MVRAQTRFSNRLLIRIWGFMVLKMQILVSKVRFAPLWWQLFGYVCHGIKVKAKLSLGLIKQYAMREWRHSFAILNFGTGWRSVVSFTSLPSYPRRISLGTHFVGGLVGPQSRSRGYGEEKNIFPLSGIENLHLIVYSQCRMSYRGSQGWYGIFWENYIVKSNWI
jgi:hypothetical protein